MAVTSKKKLFSKWAMYIFLLVILILFQSDYNSSYAFFDIKLNLIPYFLTAFIMYEELYQSVGMALACGAVCDYLSISTDGIFMLFYGIFGISVWILLKFRFRKIFLSCFILGSVMLLFASVIPSAVYFSSVAYINQSLFFICGRLLLSALFCPAIYFSVRKIHSLS